MGPVLTDVTACASGNNAIGLSLRMIQYGDADVMFAGGTEAAVTKAPMAGFAAMKAMSTRDCLRKKHPVRLTAGETVSFWGKAVLS